MGVFQKRQFEAIARIVQSVNDKTTRLKVAELFMVELEGSNTNYNRKSFLLACLREEDISEEARLLL